MRIPGTEPSSVILSKKKRNNDLKKDETLCPKNAGTS